ncbi:MAG: energy-coupling factor transporter transmembrane protein EcfT [Bacilli bacterium]|nr:energy-coupling factor transporter transmembrane protein EcfT [Bacilli bacterium]
MFNAVYGKYLPINSKLHQMNSTSKLICVLLLIISLFIGWNIYLISLLVLLTLMMMILSKVPLNLYFKIIIGIIPIIILIMLFNIIFNISIVFTILISVKIIIGVLYTMILTYTTSTTEITYGLEQILSPLKYLKISVNKVALSISLFLRLIPTIFEQGHKIMNAQASRGRDFKYSKIITKIKIILAMIFPMFSKSFIKLDNLKDAMTIRLYNYNNKRTNYRMNKWSRTDNLIIYLHMFILGLFMIERFIL